MTTRKSKSAAVSQQGRRRLPRLQPQVTKISLTPYLSVSVSTVDRFDPSPPPPISASTHLHLLVPPPPTIAPITTDPSNSAAAVLCK
ncbi:hypothetical protein Syun_023469 [Stephania yunnanensis]|uniref:Uncharacterized protein n=1 Tax=Stephania yunnanensis TaxID=152371 RepID=A0AAP0HZM0_9MAGN